MKTVKGVFDVTFVASKVLGVFYTYPKFGSLWQRPDKIGILCENARKHSNSVFRARLCNIRAFKHSQESQTLADKIRSPVLM